MTYVESWEEFAKAAERLYSQNPWKVSIHIRRPIECVPNSRFHAQYVCHSPGEILHEVQAL